MLLDGDDFSRPHSSIGRQCRWEFRVCPLSNGTGRMDLKTPGERAEREGRGDRAKIVQCPWAFKVDRAHLTR